MSEDIGRDKKGRPKTVLTVGEKDCRWPFGDPKEKDFHFCAKTSVVGRSYCEGHLVKVYEAPKRRKVDPNLPAHKPTAFKEWAER